jgi:hypothetical protein
MDTVTHALLPVILIGAVAGQKPWLGRWGLVAVGAAGALPDLLSPHLSLEARLSSWSHGLPFWLLFTIGVVSAALISRRRFDLRLAVAVSGAYLFHILCDAVSGGVNFLYPYRDLVWGAYWVDPVFWIPLDVICILACYWMFRVLPALRLRRQAAACGEYESSN